MSSDYSGSEDESGNIDYLSKLFNIRYKPTPESSNKSDALYLGSELLEKDKVQSRIARCSTDASSCETELHFNNKIGLRSDEILDRPLIESDCFDLAIVKNKYGEEVLWLLAKSLRKACKKVLTHPDVFWEGEVICITAPYRPLVYQYEKIKGALQEDSSFAALQALKSLDYFYEKYVASQARTGQIVPLQPGGSITFQNLWALYNPGDQVLIYDRSRNPRIMTFVSISRDKPKIFARMAQDIKPRRGRSGSRKISQDLSMLAWGLDWNPELQIVQRYAWKIKIRKFDGSRLITELPIYPLRYYGEDQKEKALFSDLANRGRLWQKLIRTSGGIYDYDKVAFVDSQPTPGPGSASPRLEIVPLKCRLLVEQSPQSMSARFSYFADAVTPWSIQYIRGTDNDLKNASWDKIDIKAEVFDDEKACLCPPVIRCVDVQTQKGYIVPVGDLKQVEWKSTAIEKLVLDPEKKRILLRLIKYHLSNRQKDEGDLISHKGNGLIVVLHGPPGNGKSFAAESIAEHFQTPLIAMSIGDLIADQRRIEDNLEKVFKVASKWQAVLLVDEADVVLEARSIEDVRRNAIVSVFLRQLEYFEGIFFLTTNRIDTIDPAFESRIHITMHLDALGPTGRQKIWQNFLDSFELKSEEEQPPSDVKKVLVRQGEKERIIDNLKSLAEKELNGRQIRNTFNVARAFASTAKYDPGFLTLQHLEDASVQAMALKNYFEKEKGVRVKEEYRSIWSLRRQ